MSEIKEPIRHWRLGVVFVTWTNRNFSELEVSVAQHTHGFFAKLARTINLGKSHSIFLTGNVFDMFYDGADWVPLMNFLIKKSAVEPSKNVRGVSQVVYEVNRQVRVVNGGDQVRSMWNNFKNVSAPRQGQDPDANDFDVLCKQTHENPTLAMEFLRQLTICSRELKFDRDLLIIIEGGEMLLPAGNYSSLSWPDRRRIAVLQDWFSDPKFVNGHDSVILLAESRSLIHPMVANLPQVISIEVPSPNREDRRLFSVCMTNKEWFVDMTAGLSLQAYRQLLLEDKLDANAVVEKVEEFICSQLGDDVVEFKRPSHGLKDIVGFAQLKKFIKDELIPRFQATGEEALPGAAVGVL